MLRDASEFSLRGKEGRKAMIEDKATEKLKKRAQDLGLIVNAGADKSKPATKPEKKKANKK